MRKSYINSYLISLFNLKVIIVVVVIVENESLQYFMKLGLFKVPTK